MGVLLSNSLVSGLFMLALYLAYRVFLARENQHSFNRGILLLIYPVSFLMPIVMSVTEHFDAATTTAAGVIEDIEIGVAGVADTMPSSWGTVLICIYLAGIAAVSFKTVLTWIKLSTVIRRAEKIRYEDYTLVITDNEKYAPFSWMRYIVINRGDYKNKCDAITLHELKHIQSHHWIDLLIAQIVCIVDWYNPVAWLMRDELMLVHEYQADMAVIDNGYDPQEYQMLLIKKAVGSRFPSLTNSLNHSKLKKRITMMYKKKSRAGRRFKALALVPTLALALGAVSIPAVRAVVSTVSSSTIYADKGSENSATQQIMNQVKGSDAPANAPEVMPQYPGGESAMFHALVKEIKYIEALKKDGATGRAVIRFTVNTIGEMQDFEVMQSSGYGDLDAEAIRAIKEGLKERWTPGTVDGKPVSVSYCIPVTFLLK